MAQAGTSTQVGDELLTSYRISLQKQLREEEKLVLGTGARGLDGPVDTIEPGDLCRDQISFSFSTRTDMGRTIPSAADIPHSSKV